MAMTWQKALGGIANGERDYRIARGIMNNYGDDCGRHNSTAAARLADDMAEAFGPFGDIAKTGDYKGARVLASFGAMAAEFRRLQDSEEQLKRRVGELERELTGAHAEGAALESSLSAHAKAGADMSQRLANYRHACESLRYGMTRDYPESRPLLSAYCADVDAEAAAERGED